MSYNNTYWKKKWAENKALSEEERTEYLSGNKKYMKEYRRKQKQRIIDYKGGYCELCGFKGCVAAFDLHHPNGRTDKSSNGKLWSATNASFEKNKHLLDELKLLCSNCHRSLHFK